MAERASARGVCLAVACVALLGAALGGCGGDSGTTTEAAGGGEAATAADRTDGTTSDPADQVSSGGTKRQLAAEIAKLSQPRQVCSTMSDVFLRETYGVPGEAGRKRCQAEIGSRKREVRSSRITRFDPREASVLVVDSAGAEAEMTFVFSSNQWLLDEVRSP